VAAIVPHLEQEGETTELQERYWACRAHARERGLGGLGAGELPFICPTPQAVVDQSHAGLLDMARMRQILSDQMRGRVLSVGYRGDGEVVLSMDEPISGPEWNPSAIPLQNVRVLGWTSKMQTPSFSIPAGARQMGGSCPGARAGQSIVPDAERNKAARALLPVLKAKKVNLAECICEFCYAEGGQYSTSSVTWGQMMRYAWATKALQTDLGGEPMGDRPLSECAFVQVMIDAIDRTDFELNKQPAHLGGQRFFRIHDSGDMFSLRYLRAWKEVANHFAPGNHDNPITFWAPTRLWALGTDMVKEINRINVGPDNLVLRPSAYHINQHGPERLGPGWASPSVVFDHDSQKRAESRVYDWNCKAYETESTKVTCVDSENSEGKTGCRDCWLHPENRINYTLH